MRIARIVVLVRRDLIVARRHLVAEIAQTLSIPLILVLIYGLGLKGQELHGVEGVPPVVFLGPGLVAMTALFEAFNHAAWSLWFHREVQGTLEVLRTGPVTAGEIVLGRLVSATLVGVIKAGLVGITLLGILASLGGVPHASTDGVGTSPGLPGFLAGVLGTGGLVLGAAIFAGLGTVTGTWCDRPESIGRVHGIALQPLVLLSGVFFPLATYPDPMGRILAHLPPGLVIEGGRALWLSAIPRSLAFVTGLASGSLPGTGLGSSLVDLGLLCGWAVLAVVLAIRAFSMRYPTG